MTSRSFGGRTTRGTPRWRVVRVAPTEEGVPIEREREREQEREEEREQEEEQEEEEEGI
jgi:hypothetical protein